jgi:hypothetical protein
MESLPSRKTKSSTLSAAQMELRERIVAKIADGMGYTEVAKLLSRGDKRKAYNWRCRIRRWAATDPYFIQLLHNAAQSELQLGLRPASAGLSRRAARGRVGETKLLFEASKFHSPKTMHEHTGDIKISLDIPRPRQITQGDDEVVDAEVVE